MIRTPYLIQRGEIRRPMHAATSRLSQAVDLDYMGSAEFEFGALPKSQRAMQAARGSILLRKVESIKAGEQTLRVLSCLDDEQFAAYTQYLHQMRADKIRLKENSRFGADYEMGEYTRTDFWWDIQHHVMWSFDKPFMNRLAGILESSWAYMDEQARIREQSAQA